MKFFNIVNLQVDLDHPHTLTAVSGVPLDNSMTVKLPCFKSYYALLGDLVESGEVLQAGGTFYLSRSAESPRIPKLPSVVIEFEQEPISEASNA